MGNKNHLEKTEIKKKKVGVTAEKKQSFFPKLLIVFSFLFILIAVNSYFNFYKLPKIVADAALLLAGLWLFKISIEKGFYKRRKEILKRYI